MELLYSSAGKFRQTNNESVCDRALFLFPLIKHHSLFRKLCLYPKGNGEIKPEKKVPTWSWETDYLYCYWCTPTTAFCNTSLSSFFLQALPFRGSSAITKRNSTLSKGDAIIYKECCSFVAASSASRESQKYSDLPSSTNPEDGERKTVSNSTFSSVFGILKQFFSTFYWNFIRQASGWMMYSGICVLVVFWKICGLFFLTRCLVNVFLIEGAEFSWSLRRIFWWDFRKILRWRVVYVTGGHSEAASVSLSVICCSFMRRHNRKLLGTFYKDASRTLCKD